MGDDEEEGGDDDDDAHDGEHQGREHRVLFLGLGVLLPKLGLRLAQLCKSFADFIGSSLENPAVRSTKSLNANPQSEPSLDLWVAFSSNRNRYI